MKILSALVLVLLLSFNDDLKQTESLEIDEIPISEVIIDDETFEAPSELKSGYNTIRLINNSNQTHAAHLIKLDEGYTAKQLITAYTEAAQNGLPRPDWMLHRGGVISEKGTSELTLLLEPGNYVWVCVMGDDSHPHFAGHEHQEVVVSGTIDIATRLDPTDVTITMQDDNHYVSNGIAAGRKTINIINKGKKYHLVALSKLQEGKTASDLINWFQNYNGPPPAESVMATSAIGPDLTARINLDLEPGEYVLYCMANAEGQFHLMEGAYRTFKILENENTSFEEEFNKASRKYQEAYMNADCEVLLPYLDEQLVIFENGEYWPYSKLIKYCPYLPVKPLLSTERSYKILSDDLVYEFVSQTYKSTTGNISNETQAMIWKHKDGQWKIIKYDVSRYFKKEN